jgi:CCR4-NOT transcription complex subunit 2
MFPSGAQFANRLDDFRNGGQGISSQLGAGGQPQTGNIEEFPPLGRNATADLPLGRTGALMQGGAFGNYGSGMSISTLEGSLLGTHCYEDEPRCLPNHNLLATRS